MTGATETLEHSIRYRSTLTLPRCQRHDHQRRRTARAPRLRRLPDSRLVFIIDPTTRQTESVIRTGRGPHAVTVDEGTDSNGAYAYLYVGHFTDSYIGVVDLNQAHGSNYGQMIAPLEFPPHRGVEMMRSSASRLVLLGSSIGLMIGAASCTTDPLSTSLRALESSDHMAFVCLGAPSDDANAAAMALSDCDSSRTSSASDYSVPHLYALVTQPNRGELAVVDMTTTTDAVIDQNPSVPGANFLHIGAKPGPMVATPGGIVTYGANWPRI